MPWKPESIEGSTEQDRVNDAEKRVIALLNYGGIHLDPTHSPGRLTLEYQQGDLSDEVGLMRDLAQALTDLADALEGETNS